jgi:hypothetical protein
MPYPRGRLYGNINPLSHGFSRIKSNTKEEKNERI